MGAPAHFACLGQRLLFDSGCPSEELKLLWAGLARRGRGRDGIAEGRDAPAEGDREAIFEPDSVIGYTVMEGGEEGGG